MDEGRIKPYHFSSFQKAASSLLNFKIDSKHSKLKIYFRKEGNDYFVSLYDAHGGFYAQTIPARKFERLKVFASKEYHITKNEVLDQSLVYDYYLEWVYCDYFSKLCSDLTFLFVSSYFPNFDFIDLTLLAYRSRLQISIFIQNLNKLYSEKIEAQWRKSKDDLTQHDKIIDEMRKEVVPLFWIDFKKVIPKEWYKQFATSTILKDLFAYSVDVLVSQLSELEFRKKSQQYFSPLVAYGPGSQTQKEVKKHFEELVGLGVK